MRLRLIAAIAGARLNPDFSKIMHRAWLKNRTSSISKNCPDNERGQFCKLATEEIEQLEIISGT